MKYNKEEWEGLATCIKTEQIPPRDIFEIFLNNISSVEQISKLILLKIYMKKF